MMKTKRPLRGVSGGFAVFAAMAISACGGGGGGDTAPAPTLVLTASATSAPAGGEDVAINAVTANVSGTISWTLSGPGSLSAATGNQTSYVPPLPSQLGTATDATITATIGTVYQTVKVSLTTAPGNTWQVTQPPVSNWSSVRYLDGRFYLVGPDAMLTSADGVQWTPVFLPPSSPVRGSSWQGSSIADVGMGPQGLVAVGDAGNVLHSVDGTTWSKGDVSADPGPNGLDPQYLGTSVVTYGNGRYVASGVTGVIASADGIHWLSGTAGVPYGGVDIYNLSYGNGVFFAAGYAGNYTSADGAQWTRTYDPGSGGVGAAFGNGKFVAADNFHVYMSADGLTWATAGTVGDTNASNWNQPRMSFSAGRFYAYGNLGVDVSADGLTWSRLFSVPGNDVNALITSVATSSTDTVVAGYSGLLEHSSDGGAHWTSTPLGVNANLSSIDCMNGTCIAVTSTGVLRSTDMVRWSTVPIPNTASALAGITHGNGAFVMTGYGSIYSSTDGRTWTVVPVTPGTYLDGVAYGNGRFVAIGFNDVVLSSTDGVRWSAAAAGITPVGAYPSLHSIAYGKGRFVIIDNSGAIYSSMDGVQWVAGHKGAPTGALTYGERAGFVAVGTAGASWHSVDGVTWDVAPTGSSFDLTTVSYGSSQYLAAGAGGTILISEDAVHWSPRPVGLYSAFLSSVFTGQAFIVVGASGTIVTSLK